MMALHAYTFKDGHSNSSSARYNPANCDEDDSARMECSGAHIALESS